MSFSNSNNIGATFFAKIPLYIRVDQNQYQNYKKISDFNICKTATFSSIIDSQHQQKQQHIYHISQYNKIFSKNHQQYKDHSSPRYAGYFSYTQFRQPHSPLNLNKYQFIATPPLTSHLNYCFRATYITHSSFNTYITVNKSLNKMTSTRKRGSIQIEYEDNKEPETLSGFKDEESTVKKKKEVIKKVKEEKNEDDDKTTTTTTTTTTSESTSASGSRKKLRPSTENVIKGRVKEMVDKLDSTRKNWKEEWDLIAEMRKEQEAPVDWAGCEAFDDKNLEDKVSRFHVLVACLLSSQTKDAVTDAAMKKLKAHGLTVENIIATPVTTIETLLHPVSFYKRKAVYLKNIVTILQDKYKGDIPPTFDQIMDLPGIGVKMTNLIVQVAWKRVEGIAVDVHVHRICNRLGWVDTSSAEDTTKALQNWLPKERWDTINKLLVGFGQTICAPTRPKCDICKINHLCPVGIQNMKAISKKNEKDSKVKKEKK